MDAITHGDDVIEACARELDAQTKAAGEAWRFYRTGATFGGRPGWAIELGKGSHIEINRRVDGLAREVGPFATLRETLIAALASKRMPAVPRRLEPLAPEAFTVTKAIAERGSHWLVKDVRGHVCARPRTKAIATALVAGMCEQRQVSIEEWEAKYGDLVLNGKEGTDYVWR